MKRDARNNPAPAQHPRAKRSLGQNFLVDSSFIDKIVSALAPRTDDVVLEIGPGQGALTETLTERAGEVIALEFDTELAHRLAERFAAKPNFRAIEVDALEADFSEIAGGRKLRLIANLPYNVSTAILQRLFDYPGVFTDCVLMFQREVVDRITAPPGTKDRGYLTVMTEACFSAEHLFDVPPGAFRPVPKVWSSVVKLTAKDTRIISDNLRRVVAAGFAQKRKTIANNMKEVFPNYLAALESSEVDPQRRAETLTLEEWLRVSEAILSNARS